MGSRRGLETGVDGNRAFQIRNADGPERSLSKGRTWVSKWSRFASGRGDCQKSQNWRL